MLSQLNKRERELQFISFYFENLLLDVSDKSPLSSA